MCQQRQNSGHYNLAASGCVRADYLLLEFTKLTYDQNESVDANVDSLLEKRHANIGGPPGDCVLLLMIHEFGPEATYRPASLRDNVQQILEKCGLLQGGVSFKGMAAIERKYRWGAAFMKAGGPRKNAIQRSVGFVLFDSRMNLRRIHRAKGRTTTIHTTVVWCCTVGMPMPSRITSLSNVVCRSL